MTKNIHPVFGLNKYLWAQIVASGIIPNTTGYNGLVPIIPIQEEPQFISAMDMQPGIGSSPYIVYQTYANGILSDSWYKQTDTVIYQINAVDQKKLRQLYLLIVDLFKRYDDSAEVINDYLAVACCPPGPVPDPFVDGPTIPGYEYRCFYYNYTWVSAAQAGLTSDVENDPIKATVTVRFNYLDTRNDTKLTVPPVPGQ